MKVTAGLGVAASIGGFAAIMVPHTFCIEKYKETVQLYRNGVPFQQSPEVLKRADEVLQASSLRKYRKGLIEFFTVAKMDTFVAGNTESRFGAIIGLPANFSYTSPDQVETALLAIAHTEEPRWSSREGQSLKKALVLSDKAQRFAIAREIYWANTYYVQVHAAALSLSILNAYFIGNLLNRRLGLCHRVPRKVRLVLYTVLAAFSGTMFLCIKDASSQYWDKQADKNAASMGPDYLQGGIEYYEKMLQRNRALRELMGEAGEKIYTSKGNINHWLRTPHLPLTYRLDTLREMLDQKQSPKEM